MLLCQLTDCHCAQKIFSFACSLTIVQEMVTNRADMFKGEIKYCLF